MTRSHRPTVMGNEHMASACHYLATQAALRILEAGGNAIDAGVAAGMTLGVVQPEYVNFGGVAPIIIYSAKHDKVVTVSGLGTWPKAIDRTFFQRHHDGRIPRGVLRTIVPAAPDAWITALTHWGTLGFADVAEMAIKFARDGFITYPLMHEVISEHERDYREFPTSVPLYLPNGRPPSPGETFFQKDLARTLQHMADEEKAHSSKGRKAGLMAARDSFYRGDIARQILKFHKEQGSLLSESDLADYRSGVEEAVESTFGDMNVYACGPWCQGPSLLQTLNLLDGVDLRSLGHNSAGYIHLIAEALKLAFADRDGYFGDPRFVDVPMAGLLSKDYAAERRKLIDPRRASTGMPEVGKPGDSAPWRSELKPQRDWQAPELDTSYCCVIDKQGNIFSATPSDGSYNAPVIPGLGIIASPRGSQSWADPSHPSGVAPGKRPRLTPNPALARKPGHMAMPFGSPGGDVQVQAMIQVFLNVHVFGMDLQEAIEAPRAASYSFPSSFEPHAYHPGRLNLEARFPAAVGEELKALGHNVQWWPEWTWLAGSVCSVISHTDTGTLHGGADPRRPSYAIGR